MCRASGPKCIMAASSQRATCECREATGHMRASGLAAGTHHHTASWPAGRRVLCNTQHAPRAQRTCCISSNVALEMVGMGVPTPYLRQDHAYMRMHLGQASLSTVCMACWLKVRRSVASAQAGTKVLPPGVPPNRAASTTKLHATRKCRGTPAGLKQSRRTARSRAEDIEAIKHVPPAGCRALRMG